jgi:AbrB family looped-hinge helix DNA binding protein
LLSSLSPSGSARLLYDASASSDRTRASAHERSLVVDWLVRRFWGLSSKSMVDRDSHVDNVVGYVYCVPQMPERGTARLDERGRLVLPAEMRRRLGLQAGDVVRITEEADGVLRVESRRAAARALVGIAGSPDGSSLEDLKADRRRQRAAEDKDAEGASSPSTVRPGE